jgi:hypothetical protein
MEGRGNEDHEGNREGRRDRGWEMVGRREMLNGEE